MVHKYKREILREDDLILGLIMIQRGTMCKEKKCSKCRNSIRHRWIISHFQWAKTTRSPSIELKWKIKWWVTCETITDTMVKMKLNITNSHLIKISAKYLNLTKVNMISIIKSSKSIDKAIIVKIHICLCHLRRSNRNMFSRCLIQESNDKM